MNNCNSHLMRSSVPKDIIYRTCNVYTFYSLDTMRKEKSLGIMSQKFLMLFLVSLVSGIV